MAETDKMTDGFSGVPLLAEPKIRYNLTMCPLCGKALGDGPPLFVRMIGQVCAACYKRLDVLSAYKCVFCQSAGFGEEKPSSEGKKTVLLLLCCPHCEEPYNRLPV